LYAKVIKTAAPLTPTTLPLKAHIVIVDDDVRLRDLVAKILTEEGWRVSGCRDGQEMNAVIAADPPDLIILDVMLPGPSGLDLCRELRQSSGVPIIMLTAKGEETDRVVGLELGADDYLGKPFGSRELVARIRALLRRAAGLQVPSNAPAGRKYRFDGWTVDPLRRELLNSEGVIIDLTGGEYDLLLAFVEAPQRVLTREQLLDLSRHRAAAGFDRSVDVQISRLRRKLGEDPERIIKTVRGTGYMFAPAVVRN
jgi:two-component system OmpR family response regulator